MENVVYEEGKPLNFQAEIAPRGLVGFLIRHKLAGNARQASVVLLAIAIICFVLTVIILWPKNGESDIPPPAGSEDPAYLQN